MGLTLLWVMFWARTKTLKKKRMVFCIICSGTCVPLLGPQCHFGGVVCQNLGHQND